MNTRTLTLGDLITSLYDEYMDLYKDEELASVAVAATINDLLLDEAVSFDKKAVETAA